MTTVLVAAFVAPALLVTPAWLALARRVGKQRALLGAQGAFAARRAGAGGGPPGRPAGAGHGGGGARGGVRRHAATAVLDAARRDPRRRRHRQAADANVAATTGAGTYTGVWTATEATGAALGPYGYALCLAVGGFVASTAGESPVQPTRRSPPSATASGCCRRWRCWPRCCCNAATPWTRPPAPRAQRAGTRLRPRWTPSSPPPRPDRVPTVDCRCRSASARGDRFATAGTTTAPVSVPPATAGCATATPPACPVRWPAPGRRWTGSTRSSRR